MIDEFAKDNLQGRLRRDRKALLWKLDGVSEYDARRPLTATGTNLLGLVTRGHRRGQVLRRGLRPPFPEPLPRWQDYNGSDLWATEDETRDQIIGFYRQPVGTLGRDDQRASPRRPRPRVVVAGA